MLKSKVPDHDLIVFNTLRIPDDTNYWLCRADGGVYFEDYVINNFIAVNDHGVSLDELFAYHSEASTSDEKLAKLYEKYKTHFLESSYFKNVLEELRADEDLDLQSATKIYRRKAFSAARRSFDFIVSMKVGDFLIVPSRRSQHYAIGIISSEVFSSNIDRVNMSMNDLSDYQFKRKIIWLRQLKRSELPKSLSWGLTAHRTIYDITENAKDINKLVATSYIYKNTFYHQLLVTTTEKINSYQWYQFQRSIFEVAKEESKSIFIKTDVQSPGFTELFAHVDKIPIILVGIGALFGEVSVKWNGISVKFNGPLSFFMPGAKEKREHEKKMLDLKYQEEQAKVNALESQNEPNEVLEKQNKLNLESARLDNEQKKANIEATKLANKQTETELEKAKKGEASAKDQVRAISLTDEQTEKQLETTIIHYNPNESDISVPSFNENQRKAIDDLGIRDQSIEISNQKKEDFSD